LIICLIIAEGMGSGYDEGRFKREGETYVGGGRKSAVYTRQRHTFTRLEWGESFLTKEAGGFAFAAYGRKRPFAG